MIKRMGSEATPALQLPSSLSVRKLWEQIAREFLAANLASDESDM